MNLFTRNLPADSRRPCRWYCSQLPDVMPVPRSKHSHKFPETFLTGTSAMKGLLAVLILLFTSVDTFAAIEKYIGPLDGRLTQPRNRAALNAGIWDGGSEDNGNTAVHTLNFNKNDFGGFVYSECFFTKNLHTQHIVRLPNSNGKAYLMVSTSNYIDHDIGIGIDRRPAGRLSLYEADIDPDTDLIVNPAGAAHKIVWEQEFTTNSPIGEWNHPGKMDVIGGLLLVSAENWGEWTQAFCGDSGTGDSKDAILFYDVRAPKFPRYWGKLDTHELGRVVVQNLDTNGNGTLSFSESGLSQATFDERDQGSFHWVDNGPVNPPTPGYGSDGVLDATEVIPVVNNVSLFQAGDEWILNVSNFWFRTRYVSPDINSWLGGEAAGYPASWQGKSAGTAVYPYFTNSHGQHFNSLETYISPQTPPPEYVSNPPLSQPGELRPMWFDGDGADPYNEVTGDELFKFAQVKFSPPDTATPTATTTKLERVNSIARPAPNIFRSKNDYDAVGLYVSRTGAPVIYSPLQNYPNGVCTAGGDSCNSDTDCTLWPFDDCFASSNGTIGDFPAKDTIYQITHPGNVGFGQSGCIVNNANDSGVYSLRFCLSSGLDKIVIGDNLDAETILLQSPLVITNDVQIDASGLENGITLECSGGDFFRIVEIQAGATVTMDNLTITKGYAATSGLYAGNGIGGGILNYGNLTLSNCKVYSNQADSSGAGIASMPSSTLELNNTEISSNSAHEHGAGIFSLAAPVSLSYSSVTGNLIFSATSKHGGGIYINTSKLKIENSTIQGNQPTGQGGGIYSYNTLVDIKNSTVSGNGDDYTTEGGGLYFSSNSFADDSNIGLAISRSTFSGNNAGIGGGIYYEKSANGLIANTTIANNLTHMSSGAGIWSEGTGTALTLRHVTVAGNTVDPAAGALAGAGVISLSPAVLTLENTLIADNTSLVGESNIFGEDVTAQGANLVDRGYEYSASSVWTGPEPLTADPALAPLGDNGGLTQTMQPLPGSAAIDAAIGLSTSIDQRNVNRPFGLASDIGAVEVGEAEISVEQSPGVIQVDGVTSVAFDPAAPGGSSSHTFSIRNAGSGYVNLTGLVVTIDGPDAAAFSVSQPPVTDLAMGLAADFVVIFTPGSAATHTAVIHIASSDADESSFDITLYGPGWTPIVGTPGLVYHLDAALRVNAKVGSVIEWGDSGRNGITFSQGSSAKYPVFADGDAAGNINGHPVIRFDGDLSGAAGGLAPNADQLRYVSEDPGVCSISPQACDIDSDCPNAGEVCEIGESVKTLIVVARTRSFNYLDGLWGTPPDTGLRRQNASNWVNGSNSDDFSFGGSVEVNRDDVNATSDNNLSPLNTPEIIVATRSSATKFSEMRIGDYFELAPNMPRPWHGDIAEIAVFDRLLTAQELQSIQSHLETKYAITIAPLVVTTGSDEDDGALGLGSGDSLREMLRYGEIGLTINFDGSAGDTITLNGTPLTLDKNQSLDASGLPNGLTISGQGVSRVFNITGPIGGTTTLRGLTITDGVANIGGAISHGPGGDVTPSGEGPLVIEDTTISNSVATLAGGAIYHGGASPLTLINSTLSGNTVAGFGGAIANNESVTSLIHTTISNNTANLGGGIDNFGGTVNIENSIVAANCAGGCTSSLGNDIYNRDASSVATINTGGANIIGSNDSVESFFTPDFILIGEETNKVDPRLAPLGDFGGPTQTMPPLSGSPAIDKAAVSTLAFDQRSYPPVRRFAGYRRRGSANVYCDDVCG